MNATWSAIVFVLVIANILGCLWLIRATARRRKNEPGEKDTTGHTWDGDLAELNNPMPAWWLFLFVLTIVFGFCYLAVYPGLGNYRGLFDWSETAQRQADLNAEAHKFEQKTRAFAAMDIPALAANADARGIGRSIFLTRCTGCHGSDAHGAPGYPNLTDNDWLYGGSGEQIVASITHGRRGTMPAWGATLSDADLHAVVAYVGAHAQAADSRTQRGEQVFHTYCAACHGADAKGNPLLGAPNLTDDIWLYGGTPALIETTVRNGRGGQMPAHENVLSPEKIRLVAAYVYSLSHP